MPGFTEITDITGIRDISWSRIIILQLHIYVDPVDLYVTLMSHYTWGINF